MACLIEVVGTFHGMKLLLLYNASIRAKGSYYLFVHLQPMRLYSQLLLLNWNRYGFNVVLIHHYSFIIGLLISSSSVP